MIRVMDAPKAEYPRNLGDDFKLSYRSIAEVYEAFSLLESRIGVDKSIRYKANTRPKGAAILNAIVLYVASLPVEEQRRVVRDGMGRLNNLLKIPDEDSAKSESPAEREAGPGEVDLGMGGRLKRPPKASGGLKGA